LLGWRTSDRRGDGRCGDSGITIRLLPQDQGLPALVKKYGPVYYKAIIPKGTYAGMEADVPIIGVATMLVTLESFDENLAYQITKTVIEKKADLVAIHKAAEHLSLQSAVIGSPVPFHKGAIKYYQEKGVKIP